MKKLYLAKRTVNVIFVSDTDNPNILPLEAASYLKEEERNDVFPRIEIEEVTQSEQIPPEWRNGSLIWGTDDDSTAQGFLDCVSKNGNQYQEYLRLKAIFE